MCKLTSKEETILVNLQSKTKGVIASNLNMSVKTLDVHLSHVRRKRAECKTFLKKTDPYKNELYPKRKGE